MLVLWGGKGVVEKLFKPIDLWQAQCAGRVEGECMPAGHFIPEELHQETARALRAFFA
jgi:haloacetate dehalogenase